MNEHRPDSIPPQRREQKEIAGVYLRHDENFLDDARIALREIPPRVENEYKLRVGMPQHMAFLHFFIEEFQRLPFHNEVGVTILMRSDAAVVVSILRQQMEVQLQRIQKGKSWNLDPSVLQPQYDGFRLEVFKNEIYPEMGQSGVCYSLDLSGTGRIGSDRIIPAGFRLERFHVTNNNHAFAVRENGSLALFLSDGGLVVKTESWQSTRPHLK